MVLALAFVALCAVGLPLVPLPSKGGSDGHRNQEFANSFQQWSAYPGWRFDAESWFYVALGVVILIWVLSGLRIRPDSVRLMLVAILPAVVVWTVGPIIQLAVGLPWSNYEKHPADDGNPAEVAGFVLGLYAFVLIVTFVQQKKRRRAEAERKAFYGH